jgi:hypothetical protein
LERSLGVHASFQATLLVVLVVEKIADEEKEEEGGFAEWMTMKPTATRC